MEALVNVAIPVFAIIAAGYLSGRWRVLGAESAAALNRFVYFFALPPLLFVFTARSPIDEVLNWPFIAAFLLGTLATLLLALAVGRVVFGHGVATLAVHGFAAVFANTGYMGIALFQIALGERGALPAIVATVAGNIVLIGGVVAALEATRAKGTSIAHVAAEVGATLARNPLLLASFLGIGFSYFAIPIPKPIGNFLDLMAAAAAPAALFALGLSLVGRSIFGHVGEVSWLVFLKLAFQPVATFILVRYVFDLEPLWAKSAIILAALPVGALVFVVAQQYEVYVKRASAAIVLSTAVSVVTVSALLIVLEVG